jgi:hypothetical protein
MERHISDVNTNVVGSVVIELDRQGIIEIFRVLRVDGKNTFPA